jgi:2-polyprenyl-6-methoxyphenol hydroxylase-like FAD-dependent oxidoreductase
MESAAVLADELGRADASTVELALRLFVRRRRRRVDEIQSASRRLARLMLLRSPFASGLRNWLLGRLSERSLFGDLVRWQEEPI